MSGKREKRQLPRDVSKRHGKVVLTPRKPDKGGAIHVAAVRAR